MNKERPCSAVDSAVLDERRTGPADRRHTPRGGRRSGDMIVTGLVLSAMFVTGCAKTESLSPLAPSSTVENAFSESAAPAPSAPAASDAVPQNGDDGVGAGNDTGSEDGNGDVVVADEGDNGNEGDDEAAASKPLAVQPQDATVVSGTTRQYAAKGAKGTVRWKATGGTITSKGLFKAGTTAGTFSVTASTTRQGPTTVNVTVKAATPPPPPPTPPTPPPTPPPGDDGGGGGTSTNGTVINPGDSIQNAVNANPEGTTFLIKAGVHRRQSIRPKTGMTFVGEAGAVLDGENVTPRAFVGSNINRVTIRGLRITNYAPPNTSGAIEAQDTTGWLVENNEIDHNSNGSNRTYGLRLGSDMIVRNNRIHHNGWDGISGYKAVGTTVEGNEIYSNPPATFNDSIGEAANMKCYDCGSLVVRSNYFHDGPLRGIWIDRSRPGITIENNRVINHGEAGIWYEASYRGTIRGNHVENAGYDSYYSSGWLRGGGIQVTNSPDVSVVGNTVVNSLNGIIGLQASSYYNGPYGPSELRNLLVQGNTVVMSRGQTGIAQNIKNTAVFDSWNNRFSSNQYRLGSIATPFYWNGRNMTESEWKAGPGSTDTFTR